MLGLWLSDISNVTAAHAIDKFYYQLPNASTAATLLGRVVLRLLVYYCDRLIIEYLLRNRDRPLPRSFARFQA